MSKYRYLTISNLLSLLRLLLVIPIWIFFNNFPDQTFRYLVVAAGIFALITDVLDGYFARKFNEVTEFGKIIDPLADKVVIGFVVIKLFLIGEIPAYYFIMILARDLLILIGGLLIAAKTKFVLPSDKYGKATVLAIGIVLLMMLINVDRNAVYFLMVFYLSIGLILVSFANYVYKAVTVINRK
jgi:CDP-diacylglycerol--glycerol-3-phosphate 3-phosphatidyltransferase